MLEDLLRQLINAINANTEALGGKPSAAVKVVVAPALKEAPAKKAAGTVAADKPTMDMVKAALMQVKDAHGRPAAMKIVKEEGNASELPGIKPARFSAVLAACAAIMNEADADEEEVAEEDDL